jgi:signal transduction histidine kinase
VDNSLPFYLVGPLPHGVAGAFTDGEAGPREVRRIPTADAFPDPESPPGWVILSPELPGGAVLDLLERLGRQKGPWSPVLLLGGGPDAEGEFHLLPLSPGVPTPARQLQEELREGSSRAALLSLRLFAAELSRIRHDVNNPLTAALAEVQLLLMDKPQGTEDAESLQVVEAQLKRIRDLVAQLSAFRVSGS